MLLNQCCFYTSNIIVLSAKATTGSVAETRINDSLRVSEKTSCDLNDLYEISLLETRGR